MARHALVVPPDDPGRRTVRTALAAGVSSLVALVFVLPEILQIVVDELGETLPPQIRLWLLGAAVVVTGIATAVTRVMAIPIVNDFLSRWTPFGTERPKTARSHRY